MCSIYSKPFPKPAQASGTSKKYLCIASMNLFLYSSGETIVGNLPCPHNIPDFFTMVSNFLSHVNVLI